MEDKVLTTIRKQIKKDPKTLAIDNFYLIKITDAIRSEIEGHASEIRNLSLSGCKLNSLHNFPNLPNLRRLDLNDNNLKDEDLETLQNYSNLKYLSLAGNKIKSFDAIEKLTGNKQLKMIDMFGCPLSKTVGYQAQLFKMFPKLQFVDLKNSSGEEVSYVASDDTLSEEEEEENENENDDFIDDEGVPKESRPVQGEVEGEESEDSEEVAEEDEDDDEDDEDNESDEEEDEDEEEDKEGEEKSSSHNSDVQQSNNKNSESDLKRRPEVRLTDSLDDESNANGHENGKPLKKIHTND